MFSASDQGCTLFESLLEVRWLLGVVAVLDALLNDVKFEPELAEDLENEPVECFSFFIFLDEGEGEPSLMAKR